jgi:leucyl aminopeptidase
MKVDVVRKLPEVIDTLVLCQKEDSSLDVFEEWLSTHMYESIERFAEAEQVTFKADEMHTFHYMNKNQYCRVILAGMNNPEHLSSDKVRKIIADIIRQAIKLKSKQIYMITGSEFERCPDGSGIG